MGGWEKLGHVFVANGQRDWMMSHAAWPRATHLGDGVFRVFCSVRDGRGRSYVAFVDVDVEPPVRLVAISTDPVLSPGPAGAFDELGVIPACVVSLDGEVALYYAGLSATPDSPPRFRCGIARMDGALRGARRVVDGPILEQSAGDPDGGGVACVVRPRSGGPFLMWYESRVESGPGERFAIKHATSKDGIDWARLNETCLGDANERPYVSNPSVLVDENRFRMWYSYKYDRRYRIGYAESTEGRRWTRHDERAGISPSTNGWDGEDVEYPCVFSHNDYLYMLFNGNDYGRTGFGLARMSRRHAGGA